MSTLTIPEVPRVAPPAHRAKLSLSQAQVVVDRYWAGTPMRELADEFGVSIPTISRIVSGKIKNWRAEGREQVQKEGAEVVV